MANGSVILMLALEDTVCCAVEELLCSLLLPSLEAVL
jgi:hypothetical protein